MDRTKDIRRRIVDLARQAGNYGAHLGGALSAVEILCAAHDCLSDEVGERRDRLILSKGHAALALYAVLESKGILAKDETDTFETNGTHFYAHAPRCVEKGMEYAGGSLALGISFAVGVALACKSKGLPNHVYVIVGDGECDEGMVWESLMSAANFRLANLTVIVDRNGMQLDGPTAQIMDSGDIAAKLAAFGFDVTEVDGHSIAELTEALRIRSEAPKAVIAHTVKGKGIDFCEGQQQWHHGVLTDNLYHQALDQLS